MNHDELKKLLARDHQAALVYVLTIKREQPVLFWATVFEFHRKHLGRHPFDAYGIDSLEDMEGDWS